MQSKIIRRLMILCFLGFVILEVVKCPPPDDKKEDGKKQGDDKKDEKKDNDNDDDDKKDGKSLKHGDMASEVEAMKMPIIGHFLKYVSTMYDDISSYKMKDGKPEFCHEHECPKYTVLCKNIFYEVRKYEPAKWVHTYVKGKNGSHTHIIEKAFERLYGYISGNNDKNKKIDMTVPVVVHVKKAKEGVKNAHEGRVMCMKFWIPKEMEKDVPKPKDPEVTIMDSPEAVLYVKMFGGYVLNSLWKPKSKQFAKVLKELNQNIDKDFGHAGATYDKPSIMMDRHNEIYFKAADKKDNEKYCKAS